MKFKIKNTILLILALPQKTYLHINITNYIQNLYEENYTTLMNKIKVELNKWKANHVHW